MKLNKGDFAPTFSGMDSNGNVFDSINFIGKQALVLFFYPKDFTLGCTAQACGFRDEYADFKKLGAEIIGISADLETRHDEFKEKYNLPYMLLSDLDGKIRETFGVEKTFFGLLPRRITFVINKEGIIIEIIDSLLVTDHIKKSLFVLKNTI